MDDYEAVATTSTDTATTAMGTSQAVTSTPAMAMATTTSTPMTRPDAHPLSLVIGNKGDTVSGGDDVDAHADVYSNVSTFVDSYMYTADWLFTRLFPFVLARRAALLITGGWLFAFTRMIRRWLLPRLAQHFIDGARLEFDSIDIGPVHRGGRFRMRVRARVIDAGPFPAVISGEVKSDPVIRDAHAAAYTDGGEPTIMSTLLRYTAEDGREYVVARCALPAMRTTGTRHEHGDELNMDLEAVVEDERGFGMFGAQLLNGEVCSGACPSLACF